jgi:hypothetical protein
MKLVVSKQQVNNSIQHPALIFIFQQIFYLLWCTVLIFSFGPGGLGADPDRDTSVRGTVSLCSLSLGLKKVHILFLIKKAKKAFCSCLDFSLHGCGAGS